MQKQYLRLLFAQIADQRQGLRAVFGENFDALLDLVYKDHAEEINAYAARYLRNPENNVDNQRYLTEEFLADCADAEVKPSWWKELIAKIRMWLRQRYPKLQFTNRDIEGVISMAHRRIRRDGARGNMGEYGNVWDGMGEDTAVDGATAKENLAVGADGNTGSTGNTATGAAGLRFMADEDDLSVPVVLPEQQNSAGEILSWLEKAVNGDTDLDFYGNDLAEQFDNWAELGGGSRRELLEQSYEEEIRDAKSNDDLENDLALKEAYQDAFDSIEEKISEVLEDNDLELDISKVNASGNSFYLKFEAPDDEYYTLRFSDHKQPARGSYRQNEHFGGRSIADVDVVLTNGKFDIAPAVEFIQRVAGGDGTGELRFSIAPDLPDGDLTVNNGDKRDLTEIRRKYQHSNAWKKAPNGKNTNLSEFQWLQSRTDEFKKYFGEWEAAALLKNAREAWNNNGYNFTFRFAASANLTQRIEALLGHEVKIIQLDAGTVRHIKKNHSNQAEIERKQKPQTADDILLIPYLINNFDKAELTPEHNKNGNKAVTITKRINGVSVIGTIEAGKNGIYTVTKWEKVPSAPMPKALEPNALNADDINKIQQDIAKVKLAAENSSKVIDRNGEPLVVYHGTDRYGFTVFREDSHFSADYEYAKRYSNKGRKNTQSGVYAVYLSIKNPFDIRNAEDRKIFTEYRQGHTPAETRSGAMDWAEYDFEDFREFLQENYPDKYDGVILDEGSDSAEDHRGIAYVPFSPEQIKSAADNVGTFDPSNPDIRFLLAEFSEADRRDITLILKPFVGFALDHEDRIYKEYLAKKGIAVSEKDAHAFAVTAMRENNSDRNKLTAQRREKARLEYNRKRDQYLYDNFPFYREAVEFAGSHDFKIKPSGKFRGEEFSGSFIAPEFVKYSGEKAAKNSGKLDAAQGVNSDELAARLARSWGRNATWSAVLTRLFRQLWQKRRACARARLFR